MWSSRAVGHLDRFVDVNKMICNKVPRHFISEVLTKAGLGIQG